MAAVDAVYPAARNPMAFPWLTHQGLPAHHVRRLYLMWSNQPDIWIDVSATADRKIEALRSHASQLHDPEGVFARVRERLAEQGARIGTAAAEGYRLVVFEQDPEDSEESAEVEEGLTAQEPKAR
jgi:LmbE family N-acetylglucosaminyl deacetylase